MQTSLESALEQFKQAYQRVHDAELANKRIFCICGNEFPTGKVSRIVYGSVQHADNLCPECESTQQQ